MRQLRYSVSHLTIICLSGDTGRTPLVVIVVVNRAAHSRLPPPLLLR